jgi:site-specific recombinase XerD
VFTTQLLEKFITSRPSGTSPKTIGIKCNPPSFRRGFAVHQVKSGLSNKVIQALGGWESPDMVSHYAASLTFDDALQLYKQVNGSEV